MRIAQTTIVLFAFWCVLVPPGAWLDALVGAVAALTLAVWSARFLWSDGGSQRAPLKIAQLPGFALLTAARVVTSAVQVLRIVLDPRLPIDPVVVRQTVRFDSDAARVAYANAISITPGTVTVDVDDDAFVVHCLDPALARDVIDGSLARDVARLFGREVGP